MILRLSLSLAGCYDPVYGAPKDSDTGSDSDTGTTGTESDTDTSTVVPTQVTLIEGHFVVFNNGEITDVWLASNNPPIVVQGNPDVYGWFYIDVQESAYTSEYTIDSGYKVLLSCDDPNYEYCWNGGGATEEVFGVSGFEQ